MNRRIVSIFAVLVLLIACGKDKFQSKPSLTLKSISSKTIPVSGNMTIELEYRDKEGDLANDTLMFLKVRNNENVQTTIRDTLELLLPDFPKRSQGVIQLNLDYQNYLISAETPPSKPGGGHESDSLTMKFVVRDSAGNESDTLVIDDIVIER